MMRAYCNGPNQEQALTLYVSTPQNGQTHSDNFLATADELFERVGPFREAGVDQIP